MGVQRRRPGARLRGRRRAHRHGVRPVPPDRHGLAAGRPRACSSPRRSAARAGSCATRTASGSCGSTCPRIAGPSTPRPTRRRARWVTALSAGPRDRRPPAARAVDPRQRRAGDLHRGHGGPRLAARRRLPRHQLPAGRARPAQAALDVRPVQGAGRRRHHERADGGRADDPLRDGRHPGRRRDRRDDRRRACSPPARSPAGCTAPTGSAATRCPTCSCSAHGPARRPRPTRPPPAERRTSTRSRSRRPSPSSPPRSSGPRARIRTRSSATSRTMMQRLVGIFRVEADLDEALGAPGRAAPALGDRPGDRRPDLQPGLEPRLRARATC